MTHRVSLFIPVNKDGKVLLQHRDTSTDIKPGMWAFFGGHIELGETPEAALRREVKEELGIDPESLRFFKKTEHVEPWGNTESHFFTADIPYTAEFLKANQNEGDDLGFFSREEHSGMNMAEGDLAVLNEILNSMKSADRE